MPLNMCILTAQARRIWVAWALLATALSLWRSAHFRTWFYVEVQVSWQGQHFGHGGDRRGAQIS